jgi:hypothetical protein
MKRLLYFVPLLCFLAVIVAFGGPQKFFQFAGEKISNISSGNAYGDFIHGKDSLDKLIAEFRLHTDAPILISEMELEPNEFSAFVQNNGKRETADEIYYQKGNWGKAPLKIIGNGGKIHGKLGDFEKFNLAMLPINAAAAEKKSSEIGFKDPKTTKIHISHAGNNTFTVVFSVYGFPSNMAYMTTDKDGNIKEFKKIN